MILSALVRDDPDGFIKLDENLGRHIGPENVDEFHEDAGNLVMNEMLGNPVVTREMASDKFISEEFSAALGGIQSKAFGLGRASLAKRAGAASLVQTLLEVSAGRNSDMVRNVLSAEILSNAVVNDRTMRNPKIMAELDRTVRKMYDDRCSKHGGGSKKQ